jgi:spore coat protein U-like protein
VIGAVATADLVCLAAADSIGVNVKTTQFVFFLMVIAITLGPTRSTVAGSASAPLSITVTVVRTCRLSASAYDPVVTNTNADPTAGGNMTVVCTRGSNPSIAIGVGSQVSVTPTLRAMPNGGDKLGYEIHKDSGLTPVGAESGSSVFRLGTFPSLRDQTAPLDGRIPARQNVPVQSHNDAVIVTVNF